MRHVERHIVKENDPIWQQIDRLCFLSKNLYNYAKWLSNAIASTKNLHLEFIVTYYSIFLIYFVIFVN